MIEDKLYFEDAEIGEIIETPGLSVTEADVVRYAGLSGEWEERFTDVEGACQDATRDVPDLLGLCVSSGLGWRVPRPPLATLALTGLDWQFLRPLRIGDTIRNRSRMTGKRSLKDAGVIVEEREVVNQRGEVVQSGKITFLVAKRPR